MKIAAPSYCLATLRVTTLSLTLGLTGCGDYTGRPSNTSDGVSQAGSLTSTAGTADPGAGGTTPSTGGAADLGTGGSIPAVAGMGGTTDPGTGGSVAVAGMGGSVATGGTGGREIAPDASCEDVVACGGDVAGVWFASSSCLPITGIVDLNGLGIGCTEAPVAGKLDVTGNWTVGADGSISDNTTTTGEVEIELAPPCLDISGTVTRCDRVGAPLASAGFTSVVCVDSATVTGGCTCAGTIDQKGGMAYISFNASTTGTYTAADNTLTISGIDDVAYSYCVNGNFMMVTPTTPNIVGTTNGTVVFQKQP